MGERLKDQVALVTGTGSSGPGWGNGKATAVLFAREGARVCLVDINREAAQEASKLTNVEPLGHASVQTVPTPRVDERGDRNSEEDERVRRPGTEYRGHDTRLGCHPFWDSFWPA